jgi:hypothetical protein
MKPVRRPSRRGAAQKKNGRKMEKERTQRAGERTRFDGMRELKASMNRPATKRRALQNARRPIRTTISSKQA